MSRIRVDYGTLVAAVRAIKARPVEERVALFRTFPHEVQLEIRKLAARRRARLAKDAVGDLKDARHFDLEFRTGQLARVLPVNVRVEVEPALMTPEDFQEHAAMLDRKIQKRKRRHDG